MSLGMIHSTLTPARRRGACSGGTILRVAHGAAFADCGEHRARELVPRHSGFDESLACSSAPWRPRASLKYREYVCACPRAPRSRSPALSTHQIRCVEVLVVGPLLRLFAHVSGSAARIERRRARRIATGAEAARVEAELELAALALRHRF